MMIGQKVGNYKVVRKIGEGGMGAVFEAVHESIGRRAAVKILKPAYSKDQAIVARFFREARAVNVVQHPGVVASFDYGQLPDETAYIVMEYVEGESLGQRLKRFGKLGLDALRLGRQIASALAAAHSKGIIHRDLKPDNVVIVADSEAPGGERAKVLDFGIAKITEDAIQGDGSDSGVNMTQTGMVMGTPKYMSPEQCKGAGHVDAKADVYSLGVMLFELIVGRLPFVTEGTGALIAMHIYQPPPPLTQYDPTVPLPIEALINSMLAKDPTQRPSMAEVVSEMDRLSGRAAMEAMVVSGMSMNMPIITAAQAQAAMGNLSQTGMNIGALSTSSVNVGPSAISSSNPNITGVGSPSRPSIVAVGQTQDPTKAPFNLWRRVAIPVGVAAVVLIAAVAVLTQRRPAPRAEVVPAAQPKAAVKVKWSVRSDPPGAMVVRVADGSVLGVTPWSSEQEAGKGKVGVTLRRDGYMDKQVSLDLEKDTAEQVRLDPLPKTDKDGSKPATRTSSGTKPTAKPTVAVKPTVRTSSRGTRTKPSAKDQKNDDLDIAPIR